MTVSTSFKEEWVEANGLKLHCVTNGSGKLILFLHGFPEFWYVWRNQLHEFGKDYLAVAPDMRGYNLSDKPTSLDQYEMPRLIADVEALIDHYGHGKKAILVAHDWGGAVAWNFAIQHPECLEKLIIINAPHPATFFRELKNSSMQRKASSYMLLFASGFGEAALKFRNCARLREAIFDKSAKPAIFTDSDKQAYLKAWSEPGALAGGLNYYKAFFRQIIKGLLGKSPAQRNLQVSVPTLVIWGERDTALLPGNLNGLEKFVPGVTIKRVSDGTHWVVHEQPELINSYIAEFIAG